MKPILVSVGKLAKILDLSERRIHQLANADIIPRHKRGVYDLAMTVQAYTRYIEECQSSKRGDPHDARIRREEAEADLAEMRRDEMRKGLHRDSDIARVWSGIRAHAIAVIGALPAKAAQRIHGMDVANIEAGLRSMVHEALTELAQHDPTTE